MGKAKMFGGIAVIIGLVLGVMAYVLVHNVAGESFKAFLIETYLPVLFVTLGVLAILIGILLVIYG